ncbi:metabotropic glutamate receptor 3-like [Actinia tenebrosa]|uniref:Metabotropic glutamate receptor 3-like n=1 Tax=Actinia tenebrosa TaxID=6105 RepID=A0A6P8IIU9_ACTTE|nr:metabotropic glutamate receptor 3-like [Actinia tenebrosa]
MITLHLIILNAIFVYVSPVNSLINTTIIDEEVSVYQPADVILGGLFPVHSSRLGGKCGDLDMESIALIEAMIYTTDRVNRESLIPWNLTLGYDIRDTCNLVAVSLKRTLDFLSEKKYSITDGDLERCGSNGRQSCDGKLVSVIGAGRNEISVAVNKVLSVFEIPQIGYASTSGILSDKSRFPSFSRTVVPGSHRPKVMSKVVAHFGWTYVALVTSNDPHWRSLSIKFKNLAHSKGICIGIEETLPNNSSAKEMQSIIARIKSKEKLKIILLFTSPLDTNNIIIRADTAKMTGRVWVASEVLAGSSSVMSEHASVTQGMLVIANKLDSVAEFAKYFENLNPAQNTRNPWLRNLWEKVFDCSFMETNKKMCKGTEKMNGIRHMLSFSHVNHVIDAIMAVCHVIKRICKEFIHVNDTRGKEKCLNELTKTKVLSEMFLGPFVFQSLSNRKVYLDSNGDAVSSYRIENLQISFQGAKFQTIGMYSGNTLDIEKNQIQWPNKSITQPFGKCSFPCNAGSYRIHVGSRCCWKCAKCPVGSISKNGLKCTACQSGFTSNENNTSCRKIMHDFFGWGTKEADAIIAVSIISFVLSLTVYVTLIIYKTTPIVSGLGSDTNFRLLWSISFGVLVPFAYIGLPSDNMCKIQSVLFGTSLTFTMSLVLAKAKQLTSKRKKLASRWLVRINSQSQFIFSLFLTIVELFICILWIINKPPSAQIREESAGRSIVVCDNTTSAWYALSAFHILVISIACTYLSYSVRKRLVNYSEAKYILYGMIAFYTIWVILTAVLYGTPVGLHDVAINCLAIIASQLIFLVFIFFPKLYIVFFKSKLNKDAVFYALISADHEIECACKDSKEKLEAEQPSTRPHSLSFREVSSREFPSDLSLETKTFRPSLLKKLSAWPCCACLQRDSTSAADFSDSRENVNNRLALNSYPLPIISIEEGSRSQTSDPGYNVRDDVITNYPTDRCNCDFHPPEDHEYQAENIVSLTAAEDRGAIRGAKIWNKQNGSSEDKLGKRRSRCDNGAPCEKPEEKRISRLIMKGGHIQEDNCLEGAVITNEHGRISESTL